MRSTKYGHARVRVEDDGAVPLTYEHVDHLDVGAGARR